MERILRSEEISKATLGQGLDEMQEQCRNLYQVRVVIPATPAIITVQRMYRRGKRRQRLMDMCQKVVRLIRLTKMLDRKNNELYYSEFFQRVLINMARRNDYRMMDRSRRIQEKMEWI